MKLKKTRKFLALRGRDKRDVHFSFTFHKGALVDSNKVNHRAQERIMKPDCVYMRLIDNSHNIYQVKTGNIDLPLKEFIRSIIRQILSKHGILIPVRQGRRSRELLGRLTASNFVERNFLDNVSSTAEGRKGPNLVSGVSSRVMCWSKIILAF